MTAFEFFDRDVCHLFQFLLTINEEHHITQLFLELVEFLERLTLVKGLPSEVSLTTSVSHLSFHLHGIVEFVLQLVHFVLKIRLILSQLIVHHPFLIEVVLQFDRFSLRTFLVLLLVLRQRLDGCLQLLRMFFQQLVRSLEFFQPFMRHIFNKLKFVFEEPSMRFQLAGQ